MEGSVKQGQNSTGTSTRHLFQNIEFYKCLWKQLITNIFLETLGTSQAGNQLRTF